jgi:hypothetical protein
LVVSREVASGHGIVLVVAERKRTVVAMFVLACRRVLYSSIIKFDYRYSTNYPQTGRDKTSCVIILLVAGSIRAGTETFKRHRTMIQVMTVFFFLFTDWIIFKHFSIF